MHSNVVTVFFITLLSFFFVFAESWGWGPGCCLAKCLISRATDWLTNWLSASQCDVFAQTPQLASDDRCSDVIVIGLRIEWLSWYFHTCTFVCVCVSTIDECYASPAVLASNRLIWIRFVASLCEGAYVCVSARLCK